MAPKSNLFGKLLGLSKRAFIMFYILAFIFVLLHSQLSTEALCENFGDFSLL